jgi:hypothetical protein
MFKNIARSINANDVWYDGEMILCKTEEIFNSFVNVFSSLDIGFVTGYYDPVEDKRDECVNEYTGCWYISEEE